MAKPVGILGIKRLCLNGAEQFLVAGPEKIAFPEIIGLFGVVARFINSFVHGGIVTPESSVIHYIRRIIDAAWYIVSFPLFAQQYYSQYGIITGIFNRAQQLFLVKTCPSLGSICLHGRIGGHASCLQIVDEVCLHAASHASFGI